MAPGTDMAVGFYIPAHITSCDATFVKFVTLFMHFLWALYSLFLEIFLTPTILESICGKNMFLDGCKENAQQPQLLLIVILLLQKTFL